MKFFEMIDGSKKIYELQLDPVCKKYSLTMTELSILLFLANNKEYDTASDIVKVRHIAKSHVSVSIHSLIDKEYLTGTYLADDRRTMHLKLTPSTKKIIQDGRKAQKRFGEMLLDGLSENEKEIFKEAMEKVSKNIKNNKEGK